MIIRFLFNLHIYKLNNELILPTFQNFVSVLLLVEIGWLCAGIIWLTHFYQTCPVDRMKDVMLGKFSTSKLYFKSESYTVKRHNLVQLRANKIPRHLPRFALRYAIRFVIV